jgi:hypothetical protein
MDGIHPNPAPEHFARFATAWRTRGVDASRRPALKSRKTVWAARLVAALAAGFVASTLALAAEPNGAVKLEIAKDGIGVAPADFEFRRTGEGGPGQWAVVRDESERSNSVIEQFSRDKTQHRFPLAIYKPVSLKNVQVRTRFKAVAGLIDQAGGIALRLKSPDDYYAVGANALRDEVVFFRVVRGNVERLDGVAAEIAQKQWHTLVVSANGNTFVVSLDGNWLLTVIDGALPEAGRIALWTKADSVVQFDQIEMMPLAWSE